MIICILQPGYLPWLGFFEQLCRCDVFVIYDDVQYDKNGWRNRNRIKTANGIQWLTVPVHAKLSQRPIIKDVLINKRENWAGKHLKAIKLNYSRAPYFKDYIGIFDEAYSRKWEYLVDIDMYFILRLAACLGISNKRIVRSSNLELEGDRIKRLIRICKIFKGDVFYEGASGKDYIDKAFFSQQGIKVDFQEYMHPTYRQLYGDFVPYLSVIDLLFNHGQNSLEILMNKITKEVM